MADSSVTHLLDLINQQIDYHEDLGNCLAKADALAKVALIDDFSDCSDEMRSNYFWALNDIIDNAKMMNEHTLNLLFEGKKLNKIKADNH